MSLGHFVRHGLSDVKGAREIHIELTLPIRRFDFQERSPLFNAGVVDEHIDPSELSGHFRNRASNRTKVAHVRHLCDRVPTELPDILGGRRRGAAVDIDQCDVRTFTRESKGDGLADSTPTTGDYSDLPFERVHRHPPIALETHRGSSDTLSDTLAEALAANLWHPRHRCVKAPAELSLHGTRRPPVPSPDPALSQSPR